MEIQAPCADMLHLAQVRQKDPGGKIQIQLLAQKKAEHAWAILAEEDNHLWVDTESYNEGAVVLVELSPTRQVQHIHDATHWVLEIMEQYLTIGISPTILQEEVQRAEQWRQSLTLQSQELGRRALEMEARRDQIQELEENLKEEKQKLESMAAEMETRRLRIQEMETNLAQEQQRLDAMAQELGVNISSPSA